MKLTAGLMATILLVGFFAGSVTTDMLAQASQPPQERTTPGVEPTISTAFFASSFRQLKELSFGPCRDVGGKLRIMVNQSAQGTTTSIVCEF